ncbi:hypothetical protein SANTM175S_08329 [Streptomyces antimycoticus]
MFHQTPPLWACSAPPRRLPRTRPSWAVRRGGRSPRDVVRRCPPREPRRRARRFRRCSRRSPRRCRGRLGRWTCTTAAGSGQGHGSGPEFVEHIASPGAAPKESDRPGTGRRRAAAGAGAVDPGVTPPQGVPRLPYGAGGPAARTRGGHPEQHRGGWRLGRGRWPRRRSGRRQGARRSRRPAPPLRHAHHDPAAAPDHGRHGRRGRSDARTAQGVCRGVRHPRCPGPRRRPPPLWGEPERRRGGWGGRRQRRRFAEHFGELAAAISAPYGSGAPHGSGVPGRSTAEADRFANGLHGLADLAGSTADCPPRSAPRTP